MRRRASTGGGDYRPRPAFPGAGRRPLPTGRSSSAPRIPFVDQPLPLHPRAAAPAELPPGPGPELRARRDGVVGRLGEQRWTAGVRRLFPEAARSTLQLTGAPVSEADFRAAAAGTGENGGVVPTGVMGPPMAALAHLSEAAAADRDPGEDLAAEVHALATAAGVRSPFRLEQIEPQFAGAGLSPPQTIALRLEDLREWISGDSGRDLETAPRAALFFARFLEISPFARANFRTAHLFLSFFALADGQPPIWFEVADAAGIRSDVSQAFRFDTAPLTARIERALARSLDLVGGVEQPAPAAEAPPARSLPA